MGLKSSWAQRDYHRIVAGPNGQTRWVTIETSLRRRNGLFEARDQAIRCTFVAFS